MPHSSARYRFIFIIISALLIAGGVAYIVNTRTTAAPTTALPESRTGFIPSSLPCTEVMAQESIALPVTCSIEIGGGEEPAEASVDTDGTLVVTRGSALLAAITDAELLRYDDTEMQLLAPNTFSFQDITFDGRADLIVRMSTGAYNFTDAYYAYDPAAHAFNSQALLETTNGTIDPVARTIQSYARGRGIGDIYVMEDYRFENNAYVKFRVEVQDFYSTTDESEGYVRTISELRDGSLREVSTTRLTTQEVFSDESNPESEKGLW